MRFLFILFGVHFFLFILNCKLYLLQVLCGRGFFFIFPLFNFISTAVSSWFSPPPDFKNCVLFDAFARTFYFLLLHLVFFFISRGKNCLFSFLLFSKISFIYWKVFFLENKFWKNEFWILFFQYFLFFSLALLLYFILISLPCVYVTSMLYFHLSWIVEKREKRKSSKYIV